MYVQIFQYFQNFASICAQNSVKILANPYTWRLCTCTLPTPLEQKYWLEAENNPSSPPCGHI